MQFGYVVLFSSAFPLAALCALVNNLIEIRSDALKLCTGLQRPFGQRVESIGQWQVWGRPKALSRGPEGVGVCWGGAGGPGRAAGSHRSPWACSSMQKVMEAMGVLAIVVNCYLIGQCGQLQRLFPWLSPEAAIVSVVVLEVGRVAGRRSWAGGRGRGAGRPRACSPLLLCCLSTSLCSSSTSSTWPSPTSPAGWPRRWPSLSTSAGRPSRYTGGGLGLVCSFTRWGFSTLPGWRPGS